MSSRFDGHIRKRRDIDMRFAALSEELQSLTRKFTNCGSSFSAHADPSTIGGNMVKVSSGGGKHAANRVVNAAEMSVGLMARLECERDLVKMETKCLEQLRSQKQNTAATLEESIRTIERQLSNGLDRLSLQQATDTFELCLHTEQDIRIEENKALDTLEKTEQFETEAMEKKQQLNTMLEKLRKQMLEAQSACSNTQRELTASKRMLKEKKDEQLSVEEELRGLTQSYMSNKDSTRKGLEVRKHQLIAELSSVQRLNQALQQQEMVTLQNPMDSIVSAAERPSADEIAGRIWDVTRPVRGVVSLRETLLVLKANVLNLYDDLDEITEIVDKIQSDPKYSMYPAFSDASNQWRQSKLFEAYTSAVEAMQACGAPNASLDPSTAATLLGRLKYFVVVYDLFEQHYDAVVHAIMQSDTKWMEAEDMLQAALLCRRVITESKTKSGGVRKKVVSLGPVTLATAQPSASPTQSINVGPTRLLRGR